MRETKLGAKLYSKTSFIRNYAVIGGVIAGTIVAQSVRHPIEYARHVREVRRSGL